MEDQQKKLIIGLLAYAAQRDISPMQLCELADIKPDELKDLNKPLGQKQVSDVWANAIHLSGDELFGLHFGESLQLSALGVVGEIIKSSQTVGEALTIAASLIPLITAAFKLAITHDEGVFKLHFVPLITDWKESAMVIQILDLLMVFSVHEMDGLMLKKISPKEIKYELQPEDAIEFDRVMRCKVTGNSDENTITFDSHYWNEPIITANYTLQRTLLEQAPALQKIENERQTMHRRIYNFLLGNSYLNMISLDDISSNFNISKRTLQRKLKDEGVSFQQITDEVRKALAINYLKAGNVPVKEVSYMLGYNEISAFTRTFKRWTGTTPGSYIKTLSN